MRVILFSEDSETRKLISGVFLTNFKKLTLETGDTVKECIDKMLCGEHQYKIAIIDLSIKQSIDELFEEVTDLLEDFPIILWGDHLSAKNRIPQNFTNINPTNASIFAPFSLNNFAIIIKQALAWIQDLEDREKTVELDKDECVAVKIKNFYRFEEMDYDVYLEKGDDKFLRIITKGEAFNQALIQRYVRLGTKELYLQKEMRVKFLDKTIDNLFIFFTEESDENRVIYQAQVGAACVVHEYIRTIGICEKVIRLCEKIVAVTNEVYKNLNMIRVLKDFPLVDGDISEQSILTSYVCEGLIRGIGWSSDLSRVKLGLASIIHDCALENGELQKLVSIKDPSIIKFTEEEIRRYIKHPKIAAEVSKHFTNHSEIDFVIAQHHELPNGKGFPEGLNAHQIPQLSCVFILANNFVKELVNCSWTAVGIHSIIRTFKERYDTGNFKDPMKALEKLF